MSRSVVEEVVGAISYGEPLSKFNLVKADFSTKQLAYGNFANANCTQACFTSANLSHANFQGANLSGASFYRANCENVDFRGADFLGVSLGSVLLADANFLGAKNLLCLPVGDPRGYRPLAIWHYNHWKILAGCRTMTIMQARRHWGPSYLGYRDLGNQYLEAMDWLEKQPTPT